MRKHKPSRSSSDGNAMSRARSASDLGDGDARVVGDDVRLLCAFCAVQSLCAGAIGVVYPDVTYALCTWVLIFAGIVVAREATQRYIRDERRQRQVFGWCWAGLWHLWLPCCLANLAGSGGDPTWWDSALRRRLAILVGGSGGPST